MVSSKLLLNVIILPCLGFSFHMQPTSWRQGSSSLSLLRMTSDPVAKVTVVGGTGFVGSKVCKSLAEKGVAVTSISKTGIVPDWCKDASWVQQVEWKPLDLEVADDAALDAAIGSPDSLVSCLGVIGNDPDKLTKGNGMTNCAAFASANRGGNVKSVVYVSVSEEVVACQDTLPEFLKGYFDGKKMAEECALDAVDGDKSRVCLVKPTFIYGGDSFGLNPPRVAAWYGSFIEELLSLGLIKALADVTPGLIKVALRPPSSVDAVAEACVSAALEGAAMGKVLSGGAEINEITNQPPATGLTEAIEFVKEKTGEAIDWAKEEIPKVVAKIEEMQTEQKK